MASSSSSSSSWMSKRNGMTVNGAMVVYHTKEVWALPLSSIQIKQHRPSSTITLEPILKQHWLPVGYAPTSPLSCCVGM
jgi:hypothetical protein